MKKLIMILLFLVSLTIQATTYYVAPSTASPAGSDSNSGTIGSPWLTLNHAWAAVSAGDTIYMRGGTWTYAMMGTTQLTNKSGTAGNYITIENYPGESPIINFSANTFSSQVIGIYIQNANYFYIFYIAFQQLD